MATTSQRFFLFRTTSVRTRLILWSVGVMAFVLAAMAIALRWSVQAHLLNLVDRDLRSRARGGQGFFSQVVRDHGWPFRPEEFEQFRPRRQPPRRTPNPFEWQLPRSVDLKGKPLFPYSQDTPWDPAALGQAVQNDGLFTTILLEGESLRVYSRPLRLDGRPVGVMQIAASLREVDRDVQGVITTLLMLIPVGLLFVGVSAAFLTSRMVRPVREVVDAASGIDAAGLSRRLPIVGSDEFSELVRTLNTMLDRLEESFEQQRRFVADASHELRTPLTAIKAHTSMALHGEKTPEEYRRALCGLDRSATFMAQIVQDLLHLARSDAGQLAPKLTSLALSDVVDTAVEAVRREDSADLNVQIDPGIRVMGDGGYLIRLFSNLLDNALRHTPAGGCVEVHARQTEGKVIATVRDTGCGIAPEHLPHICDRFYRGDQARARKHGGTGLGLAISKSIVDAHGGELKVESVLGEGTTVTVVLPAAPTPTPAPTAS